MKDTFFIRGDFAMRVFDKTGNLLQHIIERNLVVTVGRQSMARLLGGSGTNKNVSTIAFGTNGTDAVDGDTVITGAFTKAVSLIDFPTTNSVRFNWSLETGENNGMAITEFGLLSVDGTLFARKAREVINKTSDLRLEGTWTITF